MQSVVAVFLDFQGLVDVAVGHVEIEEVPVRVDHTKVNASGGRVAGVEAHGLTGGQWEGRAGFHFGVCLNGGAELPRSSGDDHMQLGFRLKLTIIDGSADIYVHKGQQRRTSQAHAKDTHPFHLFTSFLESP